MSNSSNTDPTTFEYELRYNTTMAIAEVAGKLPDNFEDFMRPIIAKHSQAIAEAVEAAEARGRAQGIEIFKRELREAAAEQLRKEAGNG